MTNNKPITEFVRNTLGCNCPEEVFQYIDCRTVLNIDEYIEPAYEINIGNRLLIFAACIDEVDSLESAIPKLARAGINKRDKQKFNRFRLVLLSAPEIDIAAQASEIFKSLAADVAKHDVGHDGFERRVSCRQIEIEPAVIVQVAKVAAHRLRHAVES